MKRKIGYTAAVCLLLLAAQLCGCVGSGSKGAMPEGTSEEGEEQQELSADEGAGQRKLSADEATEQQESFADEATGQRESFADKATGQQESPTNENTRQQKISSDEDTRQQEVLKEQKANAQDEQASEPDIIDVDWSEQFDGIQGAAVIYHAGKGQLAIYNQELAATRRSPCSTFKIISSATALEQGILDPAQSVRTWSGEVFWKESWNQDIDFRNAFRESCVWYFRQLIDDIGQERMRRALEQLSYGNLDMSDWEGQLNTNNANRALTGFWIESSLLISPKEQTEVMERIFGADSVYSDSTKTELKRVMRLKEGIEAFDGTIYGKTGMGMVHGIVVDAWYTGFAEHKDGNLYFCVYLGQTDDKDVTSTAARELAVKLLLDYTDTVS